MFETQKIVNHFPRESSIREDPSSFGFRYFSIIGEISQHFVKDLIRFKNNYFPISSTADQLPECYSWDVSSFVFETTDLSNSQKLRIPTVTGDSSSLTYCKDSQSFLSGLPDDVEYLIGSTNYEYLIYDSPLSSAGTINDISFPSRLYVEFDGIESYIQSIDSSNSLSANYKASLYLIGEDYFGNEINEYIYPTVDGVYITKLFYSKLLDFTLSNVGDVGTLRIKSLDFNLQEYISPYIYATTSEIRTLLIKDYDSSFFYLKYYIFPPENGVRISSEKESLAAISLLDEDSNIISINDITFSKSLEDLMVLTNDKILIYRDWLNCLNFLNNSVDRTLETLMTASFMFRFPGINQENVCYVGQSLYAASVKQYQIKLIDPAGSIFYLNDDLEFQSAAYTIVNEFFLEKDKYLENFSFEFSLDAIGQWEVVIVSIDSNDKEYIYSTSLICPSLSPGRVINLDSVYDSISIGDDSFLYLKSGDLIDKYKFIYNNFFLDERAKLIYTSENYSSLDVVYE